MARVDEEHRALSGESPQRTQHQATAETKEPPHIHSLLAL